MFYNPFLQALLKYKKHINDFFAQVFIIAAVFIIDTFAVVNLNYKNLGVSFIAFIVCFVLARVIIRAAGEKEHFGSFVNSSIHYCIVLAVFSWIPYIFFVHMRRF